MRAEAMAAHNQSPQTRSKTGRGQRCSLQSLDKPAETGGSPYHFDGYEPRSIVRRFVSIFKFFDRAFVVYLISNIIVKVK